MPSTPYAKLLVSLNGGPTADGAITALSSDVVQFSAESTAQWDLTTPPRWEIYAYPPGWTGPAAGWTTESVLQAGGGSANVYVYLGLGPPPAFALPALPMWGKFLCKLTVQGGLLDGLPAAQLVDNSTAIQIIGPNGLKDVAVGEEGQFDGARAWVAAIQDDIRLLDAALIGAATPYGGIPEAITPGSTGSAGGVNQYARGDHDHPVVIGAATTINIGDASAAGVSATLAGSAHVHALPVPTTVSAVSAAVGSLGASSKVAREDHAHQVSAGSPVAVSTANSDGVANTLARSDHVHALTFATVNTILAGASAPITINGQTLTSGGFIGPYFSTNAANPAESGLLRAANAGTIAAYRAQSTFADIDALVTSAETADSLRLGSAGVEGLTLQTSSTTLVQIKVDTIPVAQFFTTVVSFFGTADDGGGNGVLRIWNATTEPTNVSGDGASVWTFGGALKAKSDNQILHVVAPDLDADVASPSTGLRAMDRRTSRWLTEDATVTTALTYELPESCVALVVARVVGFSVDTAAGYTITGTFKRVGSGSAELVGSLNVIAQENNASWDATLDVNGNNVRVRLTGVAATDIEWFPHIEVLLMDP